MTVNELKLYLTDLVEGDKAMGRVDVVAILWRDGKAHWHHDIDIGQCQGDGARHVTINVHS